MKTSKEFEKEVRDMMLKELTSIQNTPEHNHHDIMTFAGFCTTLGELFNYVEQKRADIEFFKNKRAA